MSNNYQFENDMMYEQPAYGYYYPPMFRYPCDEECDLGTDDEMRQMQGSAAPPVTPVTPPEITAAYQGEPVLTNIAYTQAFLRTLIGRRVRITFLIGTTNLTDRTGILEQVGVSYIVLKVPEANTRVMCDLYSIKFVDIFDTAPVQQTPNMAGGMTGMGNMPGMGSMPNMGNMPGMGSMPNMGNMPGMGSMPNMGNMPGMMGCPGMMGNMPGMGSMTGMGSEE